MTAEHFMYGGFKLIEEINSLSNLMSLHQYKQTKIRNVLRLIFLKEEIGIQLCEIIIEV